MIKNFKLAKSGKMQDIWGKMKTLTLQEAADHFNFKSIYKNFNNVLGQIKKKSTGYP